MLNDAMGNVTSTVRRNDTALLVAYQVFDAFGNKVGGGTIMAGCNGDAERLASGRAQWRGGEGTLTDYNGDDINAGPPNIYGSWPEAHEQYTQPSSGLVYMQARMYDPATGRFTQADPVVYDPIGMTSGQNNRWVYCGNDPVNFSDATGQFAWFLFALGAALLALAAGLLALAGYGKLAGVCTINSVALGVIALLIQAVESGAWADLVEASTLLGLLVALVVVTIIAAAITATLAVIIVGFYNLAITLAMAELFDDAGDVSPYVINTTDSDWLKRLDPLIDWPEICLAMRTDRDLFEHSRLVCC